MATLPRLGQVKSTDKSLKNLKNIWKEVIVSEYRHGGARVESSKSIGYTQHSFTHWCDQATTCERSLDK